MRPALRRLGGGLRREIGNRLARSAASGRQHRGRPRRPSPAQSPAPAGRRRPAAPASRSRNCPPAPCHSRTSNPPSRRAGEGEAIGKVDRLVQPDQPRRFGREVHAGGHGKRHGPHPQPRTGHGRNAPSSIMPSVHSRPSRAASPRTIPPVRPNHRDRPGLSQEIEHVPSLPPGARPSLGAASGAEQLVDAFDDQTRPVICQTVIDLLALAPGPSPAPRGAGATAAATPPPAATTASSRISATDFSPLASAHRIISRPSWLIALRKSEAVCRVAAQAVPGGVVHRLVQPRQDLGDPGATGHRGPCRASRAARSSQRSFCAIGMRRSAALQGRGRGRGSSLRLPCRQAASPWLKQPAQQTPEEILARIAFEPPDLLPVAHQHEGRCVDRAAVEIFFFSQVFGQVAQVDAAQRRESGPRASAGYSGATSASQRAQ